MIDDSIITKHLVTFKYKNLCRCCECDHESETMSQSMSLTLVLGELDSIQSLENLLNTHFAGEIINDPNNRHLCDSCKISGAYCNSVKITTTSPILVIHLKRFRVNTYGLEEKVKAEVLVQSTITINETKDSGTEAVKYNLIAMVLHIGRYTAVVQTAAGNWIVYDDNKPVRIVTFDRIDFTQPYILLYEKLANNDDEGAGDEVVNLERNCFPRSTPTNLKKKVSSNGAPVDPTADLALTQLKHKRPSRVTNVVNYRLDNTDSDSTEDFSNKERVLEH